MFKAVKSLLFAVATVASISSWAGGYIEPCPGGFRVIFFSHHAFAREIGSKDCHIARLIVEGVACTAPT